MKWLAVMWWVVATGARAQWVLQESHVTASLRGIHAVSREVAWASGSGGTVLRTVDGGTTWEHCAVPEGAEALDFRGVQAFDARTALVMSSGKGDLSRLYKTVDGCKSWKLVFVNPDKEGFWDAMRFEEINPQLNDPVRRGILVGDPVDGRFAVFVSDDLGNSWKNISGKPYAIKTPRARKGEALFAASNSAADAVGDAGNLAFVTGGKGGSELFHLVNGGLFLDTWMSSASFEETALRSSHTSDAQGAFSLAHRKLDQVTFEYMVVGGDYTNAGSVGMSAFVPAARYGWFGRHQTAVSPTTPLHGYRSAVAYNETWKTWIAVGPNGTDVSSDDGRNWRALTPAAGDAVDADTGWNALSLPFAVGSKGRIGVLRDGALAR